MAAIHAPLTGHGHFDQDRWGCSTSTRIVRSQPLADRYPERVREFVAAWFEEAGANNVLPLDDRTALEQLTIERSQAEPPRTRYVYYPDSAAVPEGVAVSVRGR